jgi:hypothetical protein
MDSFETVLQRQYPKPIPAATKQDECLQKLYLIAESLSDLYSIEKFYQRIVDTLKSFYKGIFHTESDTHLRFIKLRFFDNNHTFKFCIFVSSVKKHITKTSQLTMFSEIDNDLLHVLEIIERELRIIPLLRCGHLKHKYKYTTLDQIKTDYDWAIFLEY